MDIATLYAEFQLDTQIILDTAQSVYNKECDRLRTQGREEKSIARIATKKMKREVALLLDARDKKYVGTLDQLETYHAQNMQKTLNMD